MIGNAFRVFGAVVVPLVLTWFGTASKYWKDGYSSETTIQIACWAFGVILGTYLILSIKYSKKQWRWPVTFAYFAAALGATFWIGLITSCNYGDCL